MFALLTLTPDVARAEIAVGVNGIVAGAEFSGTFRLQRFVSDGSRLLAQGMLIDVPGGRTSSQAIRIPVSAMARSCEALRVDLAETDVDVHGEAIHVNDFAVLVSDAARGPLGQSLCSVADAPDDASTLVPLLNQVVDLVGCLMRGAGGCARPST